MPTLRFREACPRKIYPRKTFYARTDPGFCRGRVGPLRTKEQHALQTVKLYRQHRAEVTLDFSEALETRFSTFKVYPLGADIDEHESDENAQLRTNGLAGQLVGDVLETQR